MDGRMYENEIMIKVTNLDEFKKLMEQANDDMERLRKTISKLEWFDLKVKFDFTSPVSQ